MATNDPVLVSYYPMLPGANAAALVFRVDGSSPTIQYEVLAYDASTIEYYDFACRVSDRYAGAAFAVKFAFSATSATSGNVVWEIAFHRNPTGEDIDTAHTFSYQSVTVACGATTGFPIYTSIAFTQAQADAIAAGEQVIMRVRRNASSASDTMTGDAELHFASMGAVES